MLAVLGHSKGSTALLVTSSCVTTVGKVSRGSMCVHLKVRHMHKHCHQIICSILSQNRHLNDPNVIDSSIFKQSEALQQETSPLNIQSSGKEVSQFFCNKEANIKSKKQPTKQATVPQFSGQWQGYN
ncbi:hypothetical protein DPMN_138567 [Dreissena polymorpha]|uniref:Uncharacterized protein n=1 Tax=Dreissena polymorpha TaxID=45954 RepID=A0A9D4G7I5_DREPO|nr:hypothetical protein DPMN_138567 [Dreissena polymorpha]